MVFYNAKRCSCFLGYFFWKFPPSVGRGFRYIGSPGNGSERYMLWSSHLQWWKAYKAEAKTSRLTSRRSLISWSATAWLLMGLSSPNLPTTIYSSYSIYFSFSLSFHSFSLFYRSLRKCRWNWAICLISVWECSVNWPNCVMDWSSEFH